ncbi:MAG: L,D-transpeptidase [Myxococcota bacterium]
MRVLSLALLFLIACGDEQPAEQAPAPAPPVDTAPAPPEPEPEPELLQPLTLWENGEAGDEVEGETAREDGYLALDLGEGWAPYLFTDRPGMPNAYRSTYLALARGEFPEDHHGDRARRDEYLELYGIMPTLGLLRTRLAERSALECAESIDVEPLERFQGFVAYRNNDRARRDARRFDRAEREVQDLVAGAGVASADELVADELSRRERSFLSEYLERRDEVAAIRAAQARLECEGFYGDTRYVRGAMDWPTHEALARFERRHRIYGWGFIGRDTIHALRQPIVDNEREDVIRVLVERAMHALGVIEDGSRSFVREGEARTYRDASGESHPIPNFEALLRLLVVESFGLQTPASTLAFLERLNEGGQLEAGGHYAVALRAPELPAYYSTDMQLEFETNRGDVWYEFPYDENGRERPQPVQRRPRLTVFVRYEGQRIPLARFGTTIGGWRSELVDGTVMWKYKQSEVGPRVISRIVASPVWLPPEGTPQRSLLRRNRGGRGAERFAVNYHETGPSYASAYGLVAAYHQRFAERADGTIRLGGDEGIRTHGSVDYMSIMRRHSHGCHRLHNHIAVRLMSFVLRHRPHRREGQQALSFRRELEHEGERYLMAIDNGGYVFRLEEPLRVNVLEGRVRGARSTPIPHPLPKYDDEVGAYVMPDGQTVSVDRLGNITPITLPDAGLDGGVLDGGVPDGGVPALATPLDTAGTILGRIAGAVGQQAAAPAEPEAPPRPERAPVESP